MLYVKDNRIIGKLHNLIKSHMSKVECSWDSSIGSLACGPVLLTLLFVKYTLYLSEFSRKTDPIGNIYIICTLCIIIYNYIYLYIIYRFSTHTCINVYLYLCVCVYMREIKKKE